MTHLCSPTTFWVSRACCTFQTTSLLIDIPYRFCRTPLHRCKVWAPIIMCARSSAPFPFLDNGVHRHLHEPQYVSQVAHAPIFMCVIYRLHSTYTKNYNELIIYHSHHQLLPSCDGIPLSCYTHPQPMQNIHRIIISHSNINLLCISQIKF